VVWAHARTGAQAHAITDGQLTRLIRIWLASRGIWEALPGAGPAVPVPATRADVARYLETYRDPTDPAALTRHAHRGFAVKWPPASTVPG